MFLGNFFVVFNTDRFTLAGESCVDKSIGVRSIIPNSDKIEEFGFVKLGKVYGDEGTEASNCIGVS